MDSMYHLYSRNKLAFLNFLFKERKIYFFTGTPTFTSGDGLEAFELIDLGLTTTGNFSGSESNAPWITS